jgi:hypothetical protein
MSDEPPAMPEIPRTSVASDVVAALVTRDERLAMTLGPARPWGASPGYFLAPLAFPAMIAESAVGREEALALGARVLGLDLEPVICSWTYGPSMRHAMDREPATGDAPFLRYERFDAPEDASAAPHAPPRRVNIRVYLARALGSGGAGEMDAVWLPLSALREAQRGIWLSTLLAMEGVTLTSASNTPAAPSPESTLIFTPASAGERQLLRACAKYGDAILFPPR